MGRLLASDVSFCVYVSDGEDTGILVVGGSTTTHGEKEKDCEGENGGCDCSVWIIGVFTCLWELDAIGRYETGARAVEFFHVAGCGDYSADGNCGIHEGERVEREDSVVDKRNGEFCCDHDLALLDCSSAGG